MEIEFKTFISRCIPTSAEARSIGLREAVSNCPAAQTPSIYSGRGNVLAGRAAQ
jgi:hypothetical protein